MSSNRSQPKTFNRFFNSLQPDVQAAVRQKALAASRVAEKRIAVRDLEAEIARVESQIAGIVIDETALRRVKEAHNAYELSLVTANFKTYVESVLKHNDQAVEFLDGTRLMQSYARFLSEDTAHDSHNTDMESDAKDTAR